jgi:SAM-dependent methyltransferase
VSYRHSAEVYDAVYADRKPYRDEAGIVAALIESRRQISDKSLLDVGCGTGLHGQHLRREYDFEGLDSSPEMLAIARERLPGVPLHEGSMSTFDLGRRFGAVVTLFSAIGHMTTLRQLKSAIHHMADHLVPGGVLVVEPWYLKDRWEPGKDEINFFPEAKVLRIVQAKEEEDLAVLEMHYFSGWPEEPRYFFTQHRLGLFTLADYRSTFADAGLEFWFDEKGLTGRGLFIGRMPLSSR